MISEKEKMLSGHLYLPDASELKAERMKAKEIIYDYNLCRPSEEEKREHLLRGLLGACGEHIEVEIPFYCDYGYNIRVGDNFHANHGCTIIDCAPVSIGDNVYIAPHVCIYTAGHPQNVRERNAGLEYARRITIGNNVWIGGNAVIKPGVTIGDNTVIGAGSVVTRNIPPNVVAAGNPCRVLRPIRNEDWGDE